MHIFFAQVIHVNTSLIALWWKMLILYLSASFIAVMLSTISFLQFVSNIACKHLQFQVSVTMGSKFIVFKDYKYIAHLLYTPDSLPIKDSPPKVLS